MGITSKLANQRSVGVRASIRSKNCKLVPILTSSCCTQLILVLLLKLRKRKVISVFPIRQTVDEFLDPLMEILLATFKANSISLFLAWES